MENSVMSRKKVILNEKRDQYCPICRKNFEYWPDWKNGFKGLVKHLAMADNLCTNDNKSLDANPHAVWREERGLPMGYSGDEIDQMMDKIKSLSEIEKIRQKMQEDYMKEEKKTKAKDILQQLDIDFKTLEEKGYKLQEEGLRIVKQAKIGRSFVQFQLSELPKYSEASDEYTEFNDVLNNIVTSGNIAINRTRKARDLLDKGIENIVESTALISGATSTCTSSTYGTITVIDQINAANNKKNLYGVYDFKKPSLKEEKEIQDELDRELREIDPSLCKRRKGAWQTFFSVSADKKAQAAHSMREIFRKLISMWASNDDVKKAEWWLPVKDAKDGVSNKQRIRFLLFGSGDIKYPDVFESINQEVEKIYESFALLNKTAHGSEQEIQLVESTMKLIESTLLRIIKLKKGQMEEI